MTTATTTDITIEDLVTYIKSEGTEGAGGIYTLSGWLTPEIAEVLLENNPHNRNLSKYRTKSMAELMSQGLWKANGSTITITEACTMGDGQHRCQAVVTSGVAIPIIFVYGVADDVETLSTLDQGGVRSVHDIIKIACRRDEDVPDSTVIAATNMMMSMTDGLEIPATDRPGKARFALEHAEEIGPWLNWAKQISRESSTIMNARLRTTGMRSIGATPLAVLAHHMIAQGADPETLQEFYQGMVSPWTLSGDVVRGMTENRRMLLEAMNRHIRQVPLNRINGGNSVMALMLQFAIHITAYNRYLRNERVQLIRPMQDKFRYFGDLPEVLTGPKRFVSASNPV